MAEGKSLEVKILTPEGSLYEGKASAVFIPGLLCPFEVLPDHAAIVSALQKGVVKVMDGSAEGVSFQVRGGVARVLDNVVTICAEKE